jgi:hypothetical protein
MEEAQMVRTKLNAIASKSTGTKTASTIVDKGLMRKNRMGFEVP